MSALAKLYASRSTTAATGSAQERVMPKLLMPSAIGVGPNLRRSSEEAARIADVEAQISKAVLDDRSRDKPREYTSALSVLESVNLAFSDLLGKVAELEVLRDALSAEGDRQDQTIQQLQGDLDAAKRQSDDLEKQNAELGNELIAESRRASSGELKISQTEKALAEAHRRIDELEEVCKTLHDGIYTIFGTNSPVQKAMTTLGRDQ